MFDIKVKGKFLTWWLTGFTEAIETLEHTKRRLGVKVAWRPIKYTLNYNVLKINLQGLWLVTNQYSDLNVHLKDLILSYKHLELNQKYFKNEFLDLNLNLNLLVTNHNP